MARPTLAVLPIGLVVGACAAHAMAAGPEPADTARPAIVVLGYPSRSGGKPHPIQSWRVALAAEAIARFGATTVVFTGGSTGGDRSEAAVMAELLTTETEAGETRTLIEDRSTSTWENVYHAMPLVDDATAVILVSDPLHAARAKHYWLSQRPEDDGRVYVFGGRGFFDHWWLQVPTALHALVREVLTAPKRLLPRRSAGR